MSNKCCIHCLLIALYTSAISSYSRRSLLKRAWPYADDDPDINCYVKRCTPERRDMFKPVS